MADIADISIVRSIPPAECPASVAIGFEYYPSSGTGGETPTILAEEGGPGSSSTGSRTGYLTLFAPIRNQRNIVIIDKRGTGRSQPVNCKAVQIPFNMTTEIAARCGRELDERSALYGTALAVDDVAAVLRELQTGPVDFYGDSYGTYFGQVLAYRHPNQLRTVVLDSAFPVLGETPWFPTEWTARAQCLRTGMRTVDLVRKTRRQQPCAHFSPQRFVAA